MSENNVDRRTVLGMAGLGIAQILVPSADMNTQNTQTNAPKQGNPVAMPLPDFESRETAKPVLDKVMNGSDKVDFSRNSEDRRMWEEIKKKIDSDLRLTKDGTLQGDLNRNFLRIESGFTFTKAEYDDDLLPAHVEPLIDQATNLLERGLSNRTRYDEFAAKMLALVIEINEYRALDEIHEEEIKDGIYEVGSAKSIAEFNAESGNASLQSRNEAYVNQLLQDVFSEREITNVIEAAQLAGRLQGLLPYHWGVQTGELKHETHTWKNGSDFYYNYSQLAAGIQMFHKLSFQKAMLILQRDIYSGLKEISAHRAAGLKTQAEWDVKNKHYQERRSKVTGKYTGIKAKAATAADGVLNYGKRLESIRNSFQADFRDALARLRVVKIGLRELYGYNDPFPGNEDGVEFFDDCLLWTRRAVQWLMSFSRLEQNIVLPVSIKELSGERAWEDGRKNGFWKFHLQKELFPDMKHIRIRGISATVSEKFPEFEGFPEHAYAKTLWQLEFKVPDNATVSHTSGTERMVDQLKLPPCFLGRVFSHDLEKEPDVMGVSLLHNASPIGQWSVKVIRSVPARKAADILNDICLHVHLAFRSKR